MNESTDALPHGWRYGLHPRAVGLQVRALGRVDLPLGEALRLELGDVAQDASQEAHVQYYISTEAGPWALWLSCPPRDLPAREGALQQLEPPLMDEP